MKGKIAPTTVAYWMILILVFAAASISLGKREANSNPTITSFSPSGTAAFAELLKQEGFTVVLSRSARPAFRPDDLAIAFSLDNEFGSLTSAQNTVPVSERNAQQHLLATLQSHVRKGGSALVLPLSSDFPKLSLRVRDSEIKNVKRDTTGRVLQVKYDHLTDEGQLSAVNAPAAYNLWRTRNEGFVRIASVGKGYAAAVADGIIATNRYIDDADNATVLLDTVATLAGPSKRVVFTEAAIGNVSEPSLMEIIGAWAVAAWNQLLLLLLVIFYTLGKAFGLPQRTRRTQRGARELMDAIAGTFQRGRMAGVAVQSALDDADFKIRKTLKLPRDATKARRDELLSEGLRKALRALEALESKPHQKDALALIREMETELDSFLTSHKSPELIVQAAS